MKTSITKNTNIILEHLTVEQAAGKKYGLRTDCRFYCFRIIASLRPWLLSWKESSGYQHDDSYVDVNGVFWSSQNWALDTEVQFIIKPEGPGLNEIRWLLNDIVNSYVAAESLNLLEKYTGERIHHEKIEKYTALPNKKIIDASIKGLKDYREINEINLNCFNTMINSLEHMVI